MSLRVLEPGLCSLVVDHGRPRTRSLGVPVGGAADRSAMAIGNAMLGNPPDAAALEIALVGPALSALRRAGAVVVGAPFQLSSGRQPLSTNKSFTLTADEAGWWYGQRWRAGRLPCDKGRPTLGAGQQGSPLSDAKVQGVHDSAHCGPVR